MNIPNIVPQDCQYDAVVMLTWSDWFTEARSNRYHYATRFAKDRLVIFVQPDLSNKKYQYINTDYNNLFVLKIYAGYDLSQVKLLNTALHEKGVKNPLLWVYSPNFTNFFIYRHYSLLIYHGTEDYLSLDSGSPVSFTLNKNLLLRRGLLETINKSDILISVSDGVEKSFLENSDHISKCYVITNGVDYKFYRPTEDEIQHRLNNNNKIILYQGTISNRLNFKLLIEIAILMPDWTFNYCGKVITQDSDWLKLLSLSNVNYIGFVMPNRVRQEAYKASVAIMPFSNDRYITDVSFPLKAFEYIACGLPVVSTPIKSLQKFDNIFYFANSPLEFKHAIVQCYQIRSCPELVEQRLFSAAEQDYDVKFNKAQSLIKHESHNKLYNNNKKLNVLILYNKRLFNISSKTNIESISYYSKYNVFYLSINQFTILFTKIYLFDMVVIDHSIFLDIKTKSQRVIKKTLKLLTGYGGYKAAFIYKFDNIGKISDWIKKLALHSIYSCIEKSSLHLDTYTSYYKIKPRYFSAAEVNRVNPIPISYRNKIFIFSSSNNSAETNILMNYINDNSMYSTKLVHYNHLTNRSLCFQHCRAIILLSVTNNFTDIVFNAIANNSIIILPEGNSIEFLYSNKHYLMLKQDLSNIDNILNSLENNSIIESIKQSLAHDFLKSGSYSYISFTQLFDETISKVSIHGQDIQIYAHKNNVFAKYPYYINNINEQMKTKLYNISNKDIISSKRNQLIATKLKIFYYNIINFIKLKIRKYPQVTSSIKKLKRIFTIS